MKCIYFFRKIIATSQKKLIINQPFIAGKCDRRIFYSNNNMSAVYTVHEAAIHLILNILCVTKACFNKFSLNSS